VLVVVATVLVLCFSVYKQSITVGQWSKGGLGYASFQWYDSQAMEYLRGLPDDIKIYTNEPAAVYLYTGRGAYVLPDRYDSATAQVRPGFEEGVARMQGEINDGKAVLAMFDNGSSVAGNVKILTDNLYVAHKSQDDEIYTAAP
jgi:hypothetical protein